MQLPVVCEHADMADEQVIMIWIAMGYPGLDFAANAVRSEPAAAFVCNAMKLFAGDSVG